MANYYSDQGYMNFSTLQLHKFERHALVSLATGPCSSLIVSAPYFSTRKT